jgi:hypothetical protein
MTFGPSEEFEGTIFISTLDALFTGTMSFTFWIKNGALGVAKYLPSLIKVAVCGSKTGVGLYHFTVSPTFIVTSLGIKFTVALSFPPAATRIPSA